MKMNTTNLEYVGFWHRVGATLIDQILLLIIIGPLLIMIYGDNYWANSKFLQFQGSMDFFLSFLIPAVGTVIFWVVKQATPGKMSISAKVIDAKTGNVPSVKQYIIRYLCYFVAIIPLFIGIIWVAFDSRKQGWHDKIAGTVVVRRKDISPRPVTFE